MATKKFISRVEPPPAERPESPESITEAADDLSLRMYHLSELVKLAAFAVEARRVLEGIHDVLPYYSDAERSVSDQVARAAQWIEMEDVASTMLTYAAREMDKLNTELTEMAYTRRDPQLVEISHA
jgi:hypothetical protein